MTNEDLKIGDWVRWSLSETMWCEGQIADQSHGLTKIAVIRTHDWPAAQEAMSRGEYVNPRGYGTIMRIPADIPADIRIGDNVLWTPSGSCYFGLSLRGTVMEIIGGYPMIKVLDVYDISGGLRKYPLSDWPENLTHGCEIDTSFAPGVFQRRPRLDGPRMSCTIDGCDMPSTGGPCRRCGYPMAWAHPSCQAEALGMSCVYVGGTAMNVIASRDVPVGVVNVSHLDPSRCASYVIPGYLKVGDRVEWHPNVTSPLARQRIIGEVIDMVFGYPVLRVQGASGPYASRLPLLGATLDTGTAPGTMQRLTPPQPLHQPPAPRTSSEPPQPQPQPVTYDGRSGWSCYRRWMNNRMIIELGGEIRYHLTPAQIAEGRRRFLEKHMCWWSPMLRAMVHISNERDRASKPSVVVEHEVE